MEQETTPWDELGIAEDDYVYALKKVRHAEVEAEDLAGLIKMIFPENPLNQALVYALHMTASEWEEEE